MNLAHAQIRLDALAMLAREGKLSFYSEVDLRTLKDFVNEQARDLEIANTLINDLETDIEALTTKIDKFDEVLGVIDDALEEAADIITGGNDPAVPTREAANFAGPYGISADGGGCRCEFCTGPQW